MSKPMTDQKIIKTVAERVMALEQVDHIDQLKEGQFCVCPSGIFIFPGRKFDPITTPNDWMMVVEKLTAETDPPFWLQLNVPAGAGKNGAARFSSIPGSEGQWTLADTIGRAVCFAALRVVGVRLFTSTTGCGDHKLDEKSSEPK